MMQETEKEHKFGWVFWLIAIALLIFCLDVAWYWAIGIVLLANMELTFTTTTRIRR